MFKRRGDTFRNFPYPKYPMTIIDFISEEKLIARKKLHRGMTLFEINYGVAMKTELTSSEEDSEGNKRYKVDYSSSKYYTEALNEKNALRHYKRKHG